MLTHLVPWNDQERTLAEAAAAYHGPLALAAPGSCWTSAEPGRAGQRLGSASMRVLVTGGAGFIGSHLSDRLLARGDDVIVLDDLSAGRAGRLDDHAELHKVSIADAAALTDVVPQPGPELICHLAAQIDVRASVDAPRQDAGVDVLGTVNLLEAAGTTPGAVRLHRRRAVRAQRPLPVPEDVLPLPESPYGIAKYCAECYIGLYNRLHGTRRSVLRLANVYGPRQDPAGGPGTSPSSAPACWKTGNR